MKHQGRQVVAFLFIAVVLHTGAEVASAQIVKYDVSYKVDAATEYERERCKLDIYLPQEARDFATIVWFHGGSIQSGDKQGNIAVNFANRFSQEGIAVVSVNYRLSPHVAFPAYIEDAAAAVAFVHRIIAQYGGDADQVFVSGHSAGGYLTSMVGMDPTFLAAHDMRPTDLAGFMPVSGQFVTHSTVRRERGIASTTPVIDSASPTYHVRRDAPAFLCIAGSDDLPARAEENRYFVAAMKAASHDDVEYREFEGRNHGTIASLLNQPDDAVAAAMKQFMTSHRSRKSDDVAGGRPPNFIVVFCDDMGYADIGPFGAEGYETPHLDSMAREGLKFTDFYVGRSFCSPSRAALMTGCIPTRVGIGGNFGPKSTTGLNPEEMTIAEVLKQKGYATACFGKWHLGHLPEFLPPQQGFDEYFGLPYSNDMWPFHPGVRHLPMKDRIKRWPHLPLYEGLEVINPQVMPQDQVHLTTQLTERAVKFIDAHAQEPFFIYLPNPQPHVPLFVSDKYDGTSARGLFGDVISEIDWQVGQIIDALQTHGIDDNTLLVFTSDNGPWLSYGNHAGSAKPLREGKGTNFEGGFRVSCLMRWPAEIAAGTVCHQVAGTIDLLPTFAALAGAPLPQSRIDGKNIFPLLSDPKSGRSPHEVFYHYDGGNRLAALRAGKWKLMFPQKYNSPVPGADGIPGKNQSRQLELSLFDLEADIGETTNVAAQHPDVMRRLLAYAEEMRRDLGDGRDVGPGRRPIGRREPASP